MVQTSKAEWVLITGCSEGGIGDALAQAFHSAGFSVIATARNTSKIPSQLSAQKGVEVVELDVVSKSSIAAAVEKVTAITGGRLHYLVNNSGVNYYMPILDIDLDTMRGTFEANVISLVAMTQAFFPLLKAAKGTVINNASSGGCDASYLPFSAAYNSSKSAASKLLNIMRLEFAPFDVKVVTMWPGGVETKIWTNMKQRDIPSLDPSSQYYPIKEEAENIMSGSFIKGEPAQTWAKDLVARVTVASPPKNVWTGTSAGMLWWMNFLGPTFVVDKALSDMTGLPKLKAILKSAGK